MCRSRGRCPGARGTERRSGPGGSPPRRPCRSPRSSRRPAARAAAAGPPGPPPAAAGCRWPAWPGRGRADLLPPASGKGGRRCGPPASSRGRGLDQGSSHPEAPSRFLPGPPGTRPCLISPLGTPALSSHRSLPLSPLQPGTQGPSPWAAPLLDQDANPSSGWWVPAPGPRSSCRGRPTPTWLLRVLDLGFVTCQSRALGTPEDRAWQPQPLPHPQRGGQRAGAGEASVPAQAPPSGTHTLERSWDSKVLGKHAPDRDRPIRALGGLRTGGRAGAGRPVCGDEQISRVPRGPLHNQPALGRRAGPQGAGWGSGGRGDPRRAPPHPSPPPRRAQGAG